MIIRRQIRAYNPTGSGLCSLCRTSQRQAKHRYCKPCKAAYMRDWRKEQRQALLKAKELMRLCADALMEVR